MSSDIHLVIFCAVDYKDLLDDCLKSAFDFIQDNILSVTIVSNGKLNTDHSLILDRDFWRLLDPTFKYSNLYKNNWIKQQILKLNLDKIKQGNILVCDVEVRFKQPIKWCNDSKFNIFYTNSSMYDSAKFVHEAIDVVATKGHITEAIIFSSGILEKLQKHIEDRFKCNQLSAYQNLAYSDPTHDSPELRVFMSEYELYANYVINYHPEYIFNYCKHSQMMYDSVTFNIQTKHAESDTQWISFYELVKAPDWPECYSASDFYNLPKHIQDECVEIHGYVPK